MTEHTSAPLAAVKESCARCATGLYMSCSRGLDTNYHVHSHIYMSEQPFLLSAHAIMESRVLLYVAGWWQNNSSFESMAHVSQHVGNDGLAAYSFPTA